MTPDNVKLAHDLLRRSRDLILQYGWIQHNNGDEESGYCMVGSLMDGGWTAEMSA